MGLQHDDEEQQLPLAKNDELESPDQPPVYSEATQFIASDASLTPPEPKATADEVRDFIIAVLTQSRGLGLDHARRVAARWTMGTGSELRQYPAAMYREVFGPEDGWVVFKEVKVVYYKKEQAEAKKKRPFRLIGLAIGFLLILGVLAIAILTGNEIWIGIAGFVVFIGGAVWVGFLADTFSSRDPEKRAENELMANWTKPLPTNH